MAHRFHDPAPPTPNDPAALGGHDHHHRFLRRLFGAQVRSTSRPEGYLDRTTALAGFCYRANSHRRNQPNLCGMMWVLSRQINDLEPLLTRNGYDLRSLVEQFDAKPAEIRQLLRGELDAGRTRELMDEMRAAGLPTETATGFLADSGGTRPAARSHQKTAIFRAHQPATALTRGALPSH